MEMVLTGRMMDAEEAERSGLVSRIVPLSQQEKLMVASWSSPESWQPGARHPGRGKYLIKTGQRVGIPVELEYVGDEAALYNTDGATFPSKP